MAGPGDIDFVSPKTEKKYRERVTRFYQGYQAGRPDRVPVLLPVGWLYPAYHAGISARTLMYDAEEMRRAWLKLVEDFPEMDEFHGPAGVLPGKIMEGLQLRTWQWPGSGLPEDAQSCRPVGDGEYLKEEEYNDFLHDASDYALRKGLPRTAGPPGAVLQHCPVKKSINRPWPG